jgi:hypothetical protein
MRMVSETAGLKNNVVLKRTNHKGGYSINRQEMKVEAQGGHYCQ